MADRQERRSITDAMQLSPDAMAFIKGKPEKVIELAQGQQISPAEKSDMGKPEIPESSSVEKRTKKSTSQDIGEPREEETSGFKKSRNYRSNPVKSQDSSQTQFGFGLNNLLVPLTTRLQPTTAAALKRAGLEQKLRGQQPATVQEIAEIAIQRWLKDSGYLK